MPSARAMSGRVNSMEGIFDQEKARVQPEQAYKSLDESAAGP